MEDYIYQSTCFLSGYFRFSVEIFILIILDGEANLPDIRPGLGWATSQTEPERSSESKKLN